MGEEHNPARRELFERAAAESGADLCFLMPISPRRLMLDDNGAPHAQSLVMRMWYRVKVLCVCGAHR